jgi:hypothetical protein
LADLGHPIAQEVIARIEKGDSTRARNVSVDEAFAFAAALSVAPVYLFLPLSRDERVKVGNLEVETGYAHDWAVGNTPLPEEDDDVSSYLRNRDPEVIRTLMLGMAARMGEPSRRLTPKELLKKLEAKEGQRSILMVEEEEK